MNFTLGFNFPINTISQFLLVFFRLTGIIFFAPVFRNRAISSRLKLGLILAMSILLFPLIETDKFINPMEHPASYVLAISKELIIGIVIGFAVRLIFTGIHLAGHIAGRQMGLGLANVLSPQAGFQMPIIAQFYGILAILIFLTINAHHLLLGSIARSFDVIPLAGFQYSSRTLAQIVELTTLRLTKNIFVIAIKLSAPIICTLFLVNLALGIIVRAVPQVNVFILGFPIKIAIGFLILSVSIRIFSYEVVNLFNQVSRDLGVLINFMAPH